VAWVEVACARRDYVPGVAGCQGVGTRGWNQGLEPGLEPEGLEPEGLEPEVVYQFEHAETRKARPV